MDDGVEGRHGGRKGGVTIKEELKKREEMEGRKAGGLCVYNL